MEVPAALPTGVSTHIAVIPNPLPANATVCISARGPLEGTPGAAPGRPYMLAVLYGGKQAVLYIAVVDDPTAYYLPPAPLTNTTAIYKPKPASLPIDTNELGTFLTVPRSKPNSPPYP